MSDPKRISPDRLIELVSVLGNNFELGPLDRKDLLEVCEAALAQSVATA